MFRIILGLAAAVVTVVVISLSVAAPRGDKTPAFVDVFDGDTIQLGSIVYNLAGIDAPELGQLCLKDTTLEPCGRNAAYTLRKMLDLSKASIDCKRQDPGSSEAGRAGGTAVAVCVVGDQDVSLALIQGGQAVALTEAPPDYAAAEKKAEQAGLGIWGSRFVEPEAWRRGERLDEEAASGKEACVIKAVPRDQRRLYFGPHDEQYDAIDPAAVQGGRTFCSDDEARAAGWRRPQA